MKIRNGFVSNSSSSSFLVRKFKERTVPNPDGSCKFIYDVILTPEQERDLEDYGFGKSEWDENCTEYSFEVICNQNCVMKFLIDNDIPFDACCHYGHEHYFWDGKSESLIYLRNFGEEYAMYRNYRGENMDLTFKQTAGHYVPVKSITDCTCDHSDLCKFGGW